MINPAMKRLMDVIETKGRRMSMDKSMDKSQKQNSQLEAYGETPVTNRDEEHIEHEELFRIVRVVARLLDKPQYHLESWQDALGSNMNTMMGLWENMHEE